MRGKTGRVVALFSGETLLQKHSYVGTCFVFLVFVINDLYIALFS